VGGGEKGSGKKESNGGTCTAAQMLIQGSKRSQGRKRGRSGKDLSGGGPEGRKSGILKVGEGKGKGEAFDSMANCMVDESIRRWDTDFRSK